MKLEWMQAAVAGTECFHLRALPSPRGGDGYLVARVVFIPSAEEWATTIWGSRGGGVQGPYFVSLDEAKEWALAEVKATDAREMLGDT